MTAIAPVLGPGTRLGAYEIVMLLGTGGMGAVYKARDTRLGRPVALKLLSSTAIPNAEARSILETLRDHPRFRRIVRTVGLDV